ncbi:NrfD/PsrC family molybdoenzyme membrane anchor subunit, partial [Turicimonas muris]
MDGTITFTTGLSEGIAWPWPIAVYLFLAGISGGAVAVALMLNFFKHKSDVTPILKSASIIGLATILLGMLCLVLDLTNPLYFWRILVYYNPTSVMSIGVMLLLFYIPLVAVLFVMCFADT